MVRVGASSRSKKSSRLGVVHKARQRAALQTAAVSSKPGYTRQAQAVYLIDSSAA